MYSITGKWRVCVLNTKTVVKMRFTNLAILLFLVCFDIAFR